MEGQIEIITDKIKAISEPTEESIKNVKIITEKIKVTSNSIDPLFTSMEKLVNTFKIVIDSLNNQIRDFYIEISSFLTGTKEITNNLKRIFSLTKRERK